MRAKTGLAVGLTLLALLALANSPNTPGGQSGSSDPYPLGPASGLPWYKPEQMSRGKIPYVTVYRLDLWEEAAKEQDPQKKASIPYEWRVPPSTVEGTRAVARDLILAWQRLEERIYAHTMTRINYQLGVTQLGCAAKDALWSYLSHYYKLDPAKPEVQVGVTPEHLPQGFSPPLPTREAAASKALRLDWYSYYYGGNIRVRASEYCGDVGNGDWPIFPMLAGSCVKVGGQKICTPNYPNPLWIDMGELEGRARRGILHALKTYIPDYEADVVKAVAPRGDLSGFAQALGSGSVQDPEIFIPTDWAGVLLGQGAIISPVLRIVDLPAVKDDLLAIWDAVRSAQYSDSNLNNLKEIYFVPSLEALLSRVGLSGALRLPNLVGAARATLLSTLQGTNYRSQVVRGIWPFEELKRWFPPSRPEVHEALGYTSYFQVFGRLDFTPLPDPGTMRDAVEYAAYSFVRSLHIWHVPLIFDYDACISTFFLVCPLVYPDVPNIRPIFIAPYEIFYTGPRYYYDWASVPEGYPIPRVKGVPLGAPVSR